MDNSLFRDSYVLIDDECIVYVEEPATEYNQLPEYQGTTINGAIKDYYSFSTNREKVAVLKWIASQPQFVEMKRFTEGENKIFTLNENEYDEILKTGEMPKNLQIAQKFVKNKYDVFLLSNPSNTKSADFIIRQKGKLFYVEGKTSSGGRALSTRLSEGIRQSNRVAVNLLQYPSFRFLLIQIKDVFHKHQVLEQLFILKGSRLITINREEVNGKNFERNFYVLWNKRK